MKRKIINFILTATLALSSVTVQAASVENGNPSYNYDMNLSDYFMFFEENTFESLSNEQKTGAVILLNQALCENLGVKHMYDIYYVYDEYDNIYGLCDYEKQCIVLNMAHITDRSMLVSTLAHECRHVYQNEHRYDNNEYGLAVNANRMSYYRNGQEYFDQFIEQDARLYEKHALLYYMQCLFHFKSTFYDRLAEDFYIESNTNLPLSAFDHTFVYTGNSQ